MSNTHFAFDAVLFDMDGTLIDTEPYWLAAETELMAEYGIEWTEEDQKRCLGGPLPRVGQYMSDLASGVKDAYFFEHDLVRRVAERFKQGIAFMPGALELLHEIYTAEVPLALVSASPRILVDTALAELPHPYFAKSITSNDVTESKPNPEGYLKAAALLKADISNSLILEDSATGIGAAKASGAFVLAIPHIVELELNEKCIKVDTLENVSFDELLLDFEQLRLLSAHNQQGSSTS